MRATASGSLRKRRKGIRVLSGDPRDLQRLSRAILFCVPLCRDGVASAMSDARPRRAKRR